MNIQTSAEKLVLQVFFISKNLINAQSLILLSLLMTSCATQTTNLRQDKKSGSGIKGFLVVNCTIAGDVRQLGTTVTYVGPPSIMKMTAGDCEAQGGEYVVSSTREQALKTWEPLARNGDLRAQTYMGEIYEKGLGVTPNYRLAAEFYHQAAIKGYSRAQNNLGFLYEKGLGVAKNPQRALQWYRKAANLKDTLELEKQTSAITADKSEELKQLRAELQQRTGQLDQVEQKLQNTLDELNRLKAEKNLTQSQSELIALQQQLNSKEAELEEQKKTVNSLLRGVQVYQDQLSNKQSQLAFKSLDQSLFGNFYALIIGNQDYKTSLTALKTPISDAQSLNNILKSKYGFRTTLLTNATREQIIDTLSRLQKTLQENDNLLIYYAGHGQLNENGRGFWLPLDAKSDSPANWISNTDITDLIEVMKARHVLIIADSCYSGALTRGSVEELDPSISEQEKISWIITKVGKRSRKAITSGGLEPVLDSGGGNHSVFAEAFLKALKNNDAITEADQIYRSFAPSVRFKARLLSIKQSPEYGRITAAGDEYGEFFFVPVNQFTKLGSWK